MDFLKQIFRLLKKEDVIIEKKTEEIIITEINHTINSKKIEQDHFDFYVNHMKDDLG